MSADIIQFVPRPNPARASLLEGQEAKAQEFLDRAPGLVVPYNGHGIDGMPYSIDYTTGSYVYHAPEKDPA